MTKSTTTRTTTLTSAGKGAPSVTTAWQSESLESCSTGLAQNQAQLSLPICMGLI